MDHVFLESPLTCAYQEVQILLTEMLIAAFQATKLQDIPTNASAPSTSDSLVVLQSACLRHLFLLARKRLQLTTFRFLLVL